MNNKSPILYIDNLFTRDASGKLVPKHSVKVLPGERLMHEGFAVGDIIRGYDYENIPDCYIQGRITEVCRDGTPKLRNAHYVIKLTEASWAGNVYGRPGQASRGSVNRIFMQVTFDWPGRVLLIDPRTGVPA
jgi:hypothetical protein